MPESFRLIWSMDAVSADCARRVCLVRANEPRGQYPGHALFETTWAQDLLGGGFPPHSRDLARPGYVFCSPDNIMRCFAERRVLEGLALTVGWGGMARTKRIIYAQPKPIIEQTLRKCLDLLAGERTVEPVWRLLARQLGWTDVMTSKCLHFMARAVGCNDNPPVPIDRAVIENNVWPKFRDQVGQRYANASPEKSRLMPQAWRETGYTWQAYNRYMTVICAWAEQKGWTTTWVENTVFAEYR